MRFKMRIRVEKVPHLLRTSPPCFNVLTPGFSASNPVKSCAFSVFFIALFAHRDSAGTGASWEAGSSALVSCRKWRHAIGRAT